MEISHSLAMYEFLASRVTYNPDTGIFHWKPVPETTSKKKTWNTRFANKPCTSAGRKRYIQLSITFNGKRYTVSAHRLAWFMFYGTLAKESIDHINQDEQDNRIVNLREASASVNQKNARMRVDNTSGVSGVWWCKQSNKWRGRVRLNGSKVNLGSFTDIDEAEKAVKEFRAQHGFTENHGKKRINGTEQT